MSSLNTTTGDLGDGSVPPQEDLLQQPGQNPSSDIARQGSAKSLRRYQTPGDRIESILEGARARKVAVGSGGRDGSAEQSQSPSDDTGGARTSATTTTTARSRSGVMADAESSADEETAFNVRRGEGLNYQSMDGGGNRPQSNGSRSRVEPGTSSIRRSGREVDERTAATTTATQELQDEEIRAGEHQGWWARLLSKYGSLELENKGSVARDHLALERTFLAWLRTSLAFASIGIAVTQLFRLNTSSSGSGGAEDKFLQLRSMGKPLGATFLGISIVILFIGFHRYFESQHWIVRGKFPASRGSVAIVAAITLALMVTSLAIVLSVEPTSFEKR